MGVSHDLASTVLGYHSGENSQNPLSRGSLLGLGRGERGEGGGEGDGRRGRGGEEREGKGREEREGRRGRGGEGRGEGGEGRGEEREGRRGGEGGEGRGSKLHSSCKWVLSQLHCQTREGQYVRIQQWSWDTEQTCCTVQNIWLPLEHSRIRRNT